MRKARALTITSLALVLLTVTCSFASAADCPNETIRASQDSGYLPDCRAYEKVSPPEKAGADIRGIAPEGIAGGGIVEASEDGNKVTYLSQGAFSSPLGAPVGSQYLSTLSSVAEGWSTQNITTPGNAGTYSPGAGTPYRAFSSNLETGLELNGLARANRLPVGNPPLTSDAPPGYQNFYLRQNSKNTLLALLTSTPTESANEFTMSLEAVTPNLEHVAVRTRGVLTSGAIEGGEAESNLYEWSAGEFQQINVLPDGTPDLPSLSTFFGSLFGSGAGQEHILSDDGAAAVWHDGSGLYLREGIGSPQAKTLEIDSTQGGSGSSGGGEFMTASSDGSKEFFLDGNKLTGNSTANEASAPDLYVFEPQAPVGQRLTDLTVDHVDPAGADVKGVLGASRDGDYIYYVAGGTLAGGAKVGSCCNLYMRHYNGQAGEWEAPRYIASLSGNDNHSVDVGITGLAFDWTPGVALRTARVAQDGEHVVFMSQESLTGYDNNVEDGVSCGVNTRGEELPEACEEVFVYDASTNTLSCASCDPTGQRPTGESGIPGGTDFELSRAGYQSRVLSEDGSRVFFNTYDSLVSRDRNGTQDVYLFEDGRPHLISSGTGSINAAFVDASTDGSNGFFTTREPLLASDTDQLVDLYDARVDGGHTETPPPPACQGENCQGPLTGTSAFSAFSTTGQPAGGNLSPPVVAKPADKKAKPKKATKKKAAKKKAKPRKRSLKSKKSSKKVKKARARR